MNEKIDLTSAIEEEIKKIKKGDLDCKLFTISIDEYTYNNLINDFDRDGAINKSKIVFEAYKSILEQLGIILSIERFESTNHCADKKDAYLYCLSIKANTFLENQPTLTTALTRNAGRKEKPVEIFENGSKFSTLVTYSMACLIMRNKSDEEAARFMNISIANFYRRKKRLKESQFYSLIDWNRFKQMNDHEAKEYISKIESAGDFLF